MAGDQGLLARIGPAIACGSRVATTAGIAVLGPRPGDSIPDLDDACAGSEALLQGAAIALAGAAAGALWTVVYVACKAVMPKTAGRYMARDKVPRTRSRTHTLARGPRVL